MRLYLQKSESFKNDQFKKFLQNFFVFYFPTKKFWNTIFFLSKERDLLINFFFDLF